ncbi:hypothetical protein [Corynebacterium flavescens]|uniref:hypothetical protein n=1 Tax=Corynebacterium flavescens TaxID=28028 RepID=UPI00289B557B|nr:hypothetical protein [Corynebacterium flavescens]
MMASLILIFALIVGVAGVGLLYVDTKRRKAGAEDALPSPSPATVAESEAEFAVKPEAVPESEPALEVEPEPDGEAEPEVVPEPHPELIEQPKSQDEVPPEPSTEPESERSRPHPHLPSLPGAVRREKKKWAEHKGFEFFKEDSYLAEEWTRGAAATGATPRDIVVGHAFGHEIVLMDLGGVGVMAARTGAASDTVVDFRRVESAEDSGNSRNEPSADLLPVRELAGFEVFSTEVAVAQRMIDQRVPVALEMLPAEITAVWMESEWVLAQTTKAARSPQWEQMLAPLALLGDVARVLPPRSTAGHILHVDDMDPTRLIPPPPAPEPTGPRLVAPRGEEVSQPPILRPEEPLELPSRVRSDARGDIAKHTALGADEVDAIADGREHPRPDGSRARLPRKLPKGSSIFGDGRPEE